jgi:hypothetical protein
VQRAAALCRGAGCPRLSLFPRRLRRRTFRLEFDNLLENQEREEKVQHLFLWECLEREKEEKGKVKRDALFSSIIYTNGE